MIHSIHEIPIPFSHTLYIRDTIITILFKSCSFSQFKGETGENTALPNLTPIQISKNRKTIENTLRNQNLDINCLTSQLWLI